ncbi:MAG: hypothetical protein [Caudoviricetes sp.]|nr:MAG: hypothetical protein [Caudoviricetes sp.]
MINMIDVYLQQVEECCPCFECANDELKKSALITALETWGDLTCGNWIDSHSIKMRIPLYKECGSCCPRIYIVNLIEEWVKEESINAFVRVWNGLKQEKKKVNFVYDDLTHDLMVDLTNVIDCCNNCDRYELIIEYDVGTDEIPIELCKWFCSVAKVYLQLNDVECAQCGSQDDIAIIANDDEKDLSATFKKMAVDYFKLEIQKYSLCEYKAIKDWTVVR